MNRSNQTDTLHILLNLASMPSKQPKTKSLPAHAQSQSPIKKKQHPSPFTKKPKTEKYTNWIDVSKTLVDDIGVAWSSKPNANCCASFIHHHKMEWEENGKATFPTLFAILGRRDNNQDTLNRFMKSEPGKSFYWECLVVERCNEDDTPEVLGKRIAREFTDFGAICNNYNIPPKFQFRNDLSTTPLKPLNYYLCDGDCLAILKRFYAEDNKKEDIMQDESIMESYFGTVALGHQMLEPINEESWRSID